ncbi:MAG: HU family DNA-binding protein [Halofilum sp. (in: g-proteobacteria)]|nr:HU family DNA-binding protein [Halofilum sp. (in: g-proteobacteria)]
MNERIHEGRLAEEIAQGDRARRERLKAMARALVAVIREGLVRDGLVRIHGFGTFRLRRSAPRAGRNPQTGERITIPARNRVLFRPAKALRERIDPERPRALPVGEPHPSREATLGAGGLRVGRPWGTVPATAHRAAGAAVDAAPAEADPAAAAKTGSREAGLGVGGVRDSHPAGALAPVDERLPRGSRPGRPGPGA